MCHLVRLCASPNAVEPPRRFAGELIPCSVFLGLDPRIHVRLHQDRAWIPVSRPGMTEGGVGSQQIRSRSSGWISGFHLDEKARFHTGVRPIIFRLITPWETIYHFHKSKLRMLNPEVMSTIKSVSPCDRMRPSSGFPRKLRQADSRFATESTPCSVIPQGLTLGSTLASIRTGHGSQARGLG
ncbi:hypothetical protein AMC78_CH01120 [Rhizobium phaseoli]|nr:hypothetical protein AMC78_CH01120 [Rhizobium phaseoli]